MRGSAEWTLLRDLATWDVGLKELLQRYKIDPNNPITSEAHLRDTLLRKIKPVAVLRHAFLKPRTTGSGGVVLRIRKLSTVYHGCEAIYRICDGNPRRLIGIVDDLCARLTASSVSQQDRLSQNEQAEVLTRASKHFLGYIHALPGGIAQWGENYLDLVTVLKAIATFFRQELLGLELPLDPHGSFIVDPNVDDKLVALLRLGVYHGAIVYVDPIPDTIETSLRGKRFRLSYMLAPGQRLPLTLYDPKSLSSILRNSARLRVRRVLPMAITAQMGLPLEYAPVRLSATQQRSASQVAGEAFDIFIAASGYEQRGLHCIRKFPVNRIPKRVAFGFTDRITPQREDNDREFSRAAIPVMLSSGDSGDVLREWLSEALEEFTGKPTRVIVDYSSMTRTWYAAILEAFLTAEVNSSGIECVFSYSVAEYSAPSYYSSNASVGPIPNFCSLSAPDRASALIIGLGYEQERALGLVEYIDPAYTCAFYTDPALDQRFRDAVLQNNQAFLRKLPRERLYPYPLADLQRTGDMLNSVCRALLDEHRVTLAPPWDEAIFIIVSSSCNEAPGGRRVAGHARD